LSFAASGSRTLLIDFDLIGQGFARAGLAGRAAQGAQEAVDGHDQAGARLELGRRALGLPARLRRQGGEVDAHQVAGDGDAVEGVGEDFVLAHQKTPLLKKTVPAGGRARGSNCFKADSNCTAS